MNGPDLTGIGRAASNLTLSCTSAADSRAPANSVDLDVLVGGVANKALVPDLVHAGARQDLPVALRERLFAAGRGRQRVQLAGACGPSQGMGQAEPVGHVANAVELGACDVGTNPACQIQRHHLPLDLTGRLEDIGLEGLIGAPLQALIPIEDSNGK